jgi:hypothetical protein
MEATKLCVGCGNEFAGRYKKRYCSDECLFWSKFDKAGGPDACWEWTGHINQKTGYGSIASSMSITAKRNSAHREAYRRNAGVDPGPRFVLHRCDNRRCGTPAHLFLGTREDNRQDALAKRRPIVTAPGSLNYAAKLDDELVRLIRTSSDPIRPQSLLPSLAYRCRPSMTQKRELHGVM